jgi:GTP cyclohydrolase II
MLDLLDPKAMRRCCSAGRGPWRWAWQCTDAAGESDRSKCVIAIGSTGMRRGRLPIRPAISTRADRTTEAIPVESPTARGSADAGAAGRLLPALWLVEDEPCRDRDVGVGKRLRRASATIVARAKLPIDDLPPARWWRSAIRPAAKSMSRWWSALRRAAAAGPLHSECLTGDVFGSLKCDCGRSSRKRCASSAKQAAACCFTSPGRARDRACQQARAYALQDRGLDTVDANRRLGFSDDERGYGMAAAMLRALGIESVKVLTNNPAKVAGLEREGIQVVERVAHHMPTNPHNADYIATKKKRSGHLD